MTSATEVPLPLCVSLLKNGPGPTLTQSSSPSLPPCSSQICQKPEPTSLGTARPDVAWPNCSQMDFRPTEELAGYHPPHSPHIGVLGLRFGIPLELLKPNLLAPKSKMQHVGSSLGVCAFCCGLPWKERASTLGSGHALCSMSTQEGQSARDAGDGSECGIIFGQAGSDVDES